MILLSISDENPLHSTCSSMFHAGKNKAGTTGLRFRPSLLLVYYRRAFEECQGRFWKLWYAGHFVFHGRLAVNSRNDSRPSTRMRSSTKGASLLWMMPV